MTAESAYVLEMIRAARAFRDSLMADASEESLIPWEMVPGDVRRGYESHRRMSAGDRWLLRKIKGELLRHVEKLQRLPNG